MARRFITDLVEASFDALGVAPIVARVF